MNDLEILIIAIFFGAFAGLIRTYQSHNLKLVAPIVTLRDRTIKIRLGWIGSVVIGAVMSALSFSGVYFFFPNQPPTSFIEVVMWACIIGWGSLEMVDRFAGRTIGDIDTKEFDLSTEINADKLDMITQIMSATKCVERIFIKDDARAGVAQIFVVPKPECATTPEEAEKVRQDVERIVARVRRIGLMTTVELPREKVINVSCLAMILDAADHEYDWYVDEIKKKATSHINSLAPGRWLFKNKLMNVLYVDRFVQDIRNLETDPPIEDGLHVKIGPDEVARAGEITVEYSVIGSTNGMY